MKTSERERNSLTNHVFTFKSLSPAVNFSWTGHLLTFPSTQVREEKSNPADKSMTFIICKSKR